MPSINTVIRDMLISHMVNVRGYSANVIRRSIAVLNRADSKIFEELQRKLTYMDPERFTVQRLDAMLTSVNELNRDAWAEFDGTLRASLGEFTAYEVAFQTGMFEKAMAGITFPIAKVIPEQVYAAAMARPFQGALLKDFLKDIEAKKARDIRRTIADGYVQAKTTDQIIREIRGTAAKGYADGIIEISRRDAAAVVRTALSHTSAFAQQKVYDANADLIKEYQWLATLDTRTTPACQLRDGKRYTKEFKPIGHSLPWGAGPGLFHWSCRSTRLPITYSWRELGIDRDEIKPSTRASMDGQVPADITYEEWLRKQSPERQDEILGKAKAEQFRKGELTLAQLHAAPAQPKTIEELRAADQTENLLSKHYDKFADKTATAESVMDAYRNRKTGETLTDADRKEIADKLALADSLPSSMSQNVGPDGIYTPERQKLHEEIMEKIFKPEDVMNALPAEGEQPTFVILGGRGGSGKSGFTDGKIKEFDASKFLTLDSDAIKGMLPGYEGWNAAVFHEESSYLFERATRIAADLNVNFISDATLKSMKIIDTMEDLIERGYRTEAHYMFLPPQDAATRALGRYLKSGPDDRGRLVPVDIILKNTQNERNFDTIKGMVDRWSAYDNQGAFPTLIGRGENQ
jgi:SPP1 gp7 family putative phage head morphogenesis protein